MQPGRELQLRTIRAKDGIGWKTEGESSEGEEHAPHAPKKLRLYNHLDLQGEATGVWFRQTAGSDMQRAIEHDYYSHIIQAIGRARAALRPASAPPVQVLILCNEPVGNLKIDRLVTVRELVRESEIAARQTKVEAVEATGRAAAALAGGN